MCQQGESLHCGTFTLAAGWRMGRKGWLGQRQRGKGGAVDQLYEKWRWGQQSQARRISSCSLSPWRKLRCETSLGWSSQPQPVGAIYYHPSFSWQEASQVASGLLVGSLAPGQGQAQR